ncbi:MAG TPA: hypothetical protein VI233_15905 [Puia sp.]
MFSKKILLSLVFVLALSAAAMAGYRWWGHMAVSPVPENPLPPAAEELARVMRAYREADSSSAISGIIRIYDREDKDALKETRPFRFGRSGKGFYAQLSYLQTFCDGDLLLQLDTLHRRIFLSKAPAAGMGEASFSNTPIETLFSDTASFKTTGVVSAEGKERGLHLQSEAAPGLRSSTLHYDTLTYRLNRAEIEWWKPSARQDEMGNKIWLAKISYQYAPAGRVDIREKIRSIVTITGRQVNLKDAYHDYELNLDNN